MSAEVWLQERPGWCPHSSCQFVRRVTDTLCGGQLPDPQEHDGDFNTHRICLNGMADDGSVFDLQINKTDINWFRWLFNALLTGENDDECEHKSMFDEGDYVCPDCGEAL